MPHKPPVRDSVLRDLSDLVRSAKGLTPGAQRRLLDKIDQCDQFLYEDSITAVAGTDDTKPKGKGR